MEPTQQARRDDLQAPQAEQYQLTGEQVIVKVRELLHEGNVRRIIIKNEAGHTIAEFPLTIGLVGAVLAPMLAAVGAVAALIIDCTIEVERRES